MYRPTALWSWARQLRPVVVTCFVGRSRDLWSELVATVSHAAVSDDGTVVAGSILIPPSRLEAFTSTNGGSVELLGGDVGDPVGSIAYGVSSGGDVIVGDLAGGSFRWTESAGFVDLGTLSGGENNSLALSVSADGSTVAGIARAANGRDEAFRWTLSSGMVGLGLFPRAVSSNAYSVSGDGSVIVGRNNFFEPPPGGQTAISHSEAFRWTESEGMAPLIDLPYPFYTSSAVDVSADGSVIVGNIGTTSPFPGNPLVGAFYWTAETGALNLRDVLLSGGATGLESGTFLHALAVSADGRTVVGTAFLDGVTQGFVATVPEPSTVVLAVMAAACGIGVYVRNLRRARLPG
jgi:probable HAF family extracellular repeat protein